MVNLPKIFKEDESIMSNQIFSLLPLRDIVVFPHMVAPLFVGRTKSVNALTDSMNKDKIVFLATQKSANIDNPTEKDINRTGTVGKLLQLLRLPDGTVKALVEGKRRGRIVRFIPHKDFFQVEIEPVVEPKVSDAEATALIRSIIAEFEEYAKLNKNISKDLVSSVISITDPSQLADTVAAHFSFKIEDKQHILEETNPSERLPLLLGLVKMEIEIFRMDQRIKGRVKDQMEKTQKNYYLNEQMRAIKKEMGHDDDSIDDINELEEKIEKKKMSEEATEKVNKRAQKAKDDDAYVG
jgi:ATP-dependent Lon protease